jgi:hypothetical protein
MQRFKSPQSTVYKALKVLELAGVLIWQNVSVHGGGGDSERRLVRRIGVGGGGHRTKSAKVELRDFNQGRERIR